MFNLLAQLDSTAPGAAIAQTVAFIIGITCFWTAFAVFIEAMIASACMKSYSGCYFQVKPSMLYKATKLNKFGSWFVTILIRILNPVMTIWYGIHWICTCNKKEVGSNE